MQDNAAGMSAERRKQGDRPQARIQIFPKNDRLVSICHHVVRRLGGALLHPVAPDRTMLRKQTINKHSNAIHGLS
jgi:hypothetical protein